MLILARNMLLAPTALLLLHLLLRLGPTSSAFVSNLDVTCMKCLCTASTGCNEKFDCSPDGFCGPFFISRKYWEGAGSVTLTPYRPSSDGGYRDCVKNFQCASKVVANYMTETAWDCNDDGVTDCDDYARIHYFGPERCDQYIENSLFHKRYMTCRPPKAVDDLSLLGR